MRARVFLAAATVVLAGCGSDGGDAASLPSTSGVTPTTIDAETIGRRVADAVNSAGTREVDYLDTNPARLGEIVLDYCGDRKAVGPTAAQDNVADALAGYIAANSTGANAGDARLSALSADLLAPMVADAADEIACGG